MRLSRQINRTGLTLHCEGDRRVKEYFLNLLRYDDWANRRIIVALPEIVDAEPRALVLFSHIIMVQKLWLVRLLQTEGKFELWSPVPLPELVREMHMTSRGWIEYLGNLAETDFDRMVRYKNTKGHDWENTIQEIFTQMINHGTHHRGQIVALIRKQGLTPPTIDFIVFARNDA